MIGVVIPALNEAQTLPALLGDLRELAKILPLDVVVVDGGSSDRTVDCALAAGVRFVGARPGRARQLNQGALAARGDWYLFLHADTRVPAEARGALRDALAGPPSFEAAVFRFAIDLPPVWKGLIETGQALREALVGLPYGDQGLLIRRALFEAVGGYPDLPIMEDVALIRMLRRRTHVARIPAAVRTSGRRYLQGGVMRTWLRHSVLISLYFAGVSPALLARWRDGTPVRA